MIIQKFVVLTVLILVFIISSCSSNTKESISEFSSESSSFSEGDTTSIINSSSFTTSDYDSTSAESENTGSDSSSDFEETSSDFNLSPTSKPVVTSTPVPPTPTSTVSDSITPFDDWIPSTFIDFSNNYTQFMDGTININTGNIINPNIIGFGMNVSFSDHEYVRYPSGNEWSGRSQHIPAPNDDFGWRRYYELMDFMGFDYIRLGVGITQWEPINDNTDPWSMNLKDGFVFSPEFKQKNPLGFENNEIYMKQMYRLLDHWEAKNKYVILGNWWVGPDNFTPDLTNWLASKNPDGTRKFDIYDRVNPGISDIDEFTESLAAIMYHLKVEKEYNSVKGISVWNEPEHFTDHFSTLNSIYQSLGEQLKKYNIRYKVKVQALDSAFFWFAEGGTDRRLVEKFINESGEHIDILSFHDYNSGLEFMRLLNVPNMHGTLSNNMVDKILKPGIIQGASDGRERPVIVGEFGGAIPSQTGESSTPDFMQRIHSAQGAIHLFNNGGKAIAYWIFNNTTHKYWSALKYNPDYSNLFDPLDVNYYPLSLSMKYFPKGTDIVFSEITGFKDQKSNQRVFSMTGVKGDEISILLVNDSKYAAKVDLNGISSSKPFRYFWVDSKRYNQIYSAGETILNNNPQITLRPESITVLTTYKYGTPTPNTENLP